MTDDQINAQRIYYGLWREHGIEVLHTMTWAIGRCHRFGYRQVLGNL